MKLSKSFSSLFFLFIILASTIQTSIAQSQKVTHISSKDAIILNEENTIHISGVIISSMVYSVTKKLSVKILSAEGIKRFSNYELPESFDQSYIAHFPKERKYQNLYSKIKCNYFKVNITTSTGEKKAPKTIQDVETVQMVIPEENVYGNYDRPFCIIKNLQIGDQLDIEYNYDVMYYDNFYILSSFRIFFNSEVDKTTYKLSFSYDPELPIKFSFNNVAEPDSTIVRDKFTQYIWSKNNLKGCIFESGSIPYKSLPFVTFVVKPKELVYNYAKALYPQDLPYYIQYAYMREQKHRNIAISVNQGVLTSKYFLLKKYVETEAQDVKDDGTGYNKLLKLHNKIADEFKFNTDIEYFNQANIDEPDLGVEFNRNTLRDVIRYDQYIGLIRSLNLNYVTTYVGDKRSGEVSENFYTPMFDNDYLISIILKNEKMINIYPKGSDFGYYLNEIPFYFENTNGICVHITDYGDHSTPIKYDLRNIQLPIHSFSDNMRTNTVHVNINTSSKSVSFDAKINLSGQFSTMIRGIYKTDYADKSVNSLYNKKIWELNEKSSLQKKEVNIINREFPFDAEITAQYQANTILTKIGDTLNLNLTNWFNHIIYPDFDTTGRQMDFYPDFVGKDTYFYMLQFDKNVKLASEFQDIKIANEFGQLSISIEKVSSNTYKLTSSFATISDKVSKEKIQSVKDIYDKIQALNSGTLKFVVE